MRSKGGIREAVLLWSVLGCLFIVTSEAQGAQCQIPGTPGVQPGKCTLNCPINPNGALVDIQAWGLDARINLNCPDTNTSLACNSQSLVEPLLGGTDTLLGCRAFGSGNFGGACECTTVANGGFLTTSGRCSCQ